jgi:hypothetical protein|nr:MAG TPA: hypothetical protein [Caudoviricetes sp.]
MIYSRASYVDRVEIKSFNRNIEEDVTLMLIALRDIKQSMTGYYSAHYEINWHIRDQKQPVTDSNGDRVGWCKLQYVDNRWIYCHNDICMQFTRNELKTSILYVRDGDVFVSLENLLNTIISILVAVGIPEQYLFSQKQKEFLINSGVRRAMEEKLIEINNRVNLLDDRIERDGQQERDDETNQNLHIMRRSLESALFDKDNAERFLAAVDV